MTEKRFTFAALLSLAASPAAAMEPVPTGITGVGASMIIFTVAAAVLLTLLFRAAANHATRYLGQRAGRSRLRRRLRSGGRKVLSDFILPGAYGGLARIDHALLVDGGIVCIRAVHLEGTVSGGENDPQWAVVEGPARRRFLNPLIQNEGRVRAVRKVLPDVPVANLVVFTGNVRFAAPPPANVLALDGLDGHVRNFAFTQSPGIDGNAAWDRLNAAILSDADSRKDFAAQISFS